MRCNICKESISRDEVIKAFQRDEEGGLEEMWKVCSINPCLEQLKEKYPGLEVEFNHNE